MTRPAFGLEPNPDVYARWLDRIGAFVLDYLAHTDEHSVGGAVGAVGHRIADEISQEVGEQPLDGGIDRIIELLDRAASAALNATSPGYLAYVPGGGIVPAALADLIAGTLNRYVGNVSASPGMCRIEADVLAWLIREFGYGPDAWGVFTSGGSMANFGAAVAARHHAFGDSGKFSRATAYLTRQTHHSMTKALWIAGIPRSAVRMVATDPEFRMVPDDLARHIAADRAAGRVPFFVGVAAGTTNTGAIDPLVDIAAVCERERVWLHVDAAYGGAFVLCDRGRALLRGIERADSIAFDPHKGLFLPYGTGCLLARDGQSLRRAHHVSADYLQDLDAAERSGAPPNPADYGLEFSRPFRGLRIWLPLMLYGARAFRDALDEKLDLAARFCRGLDARIARGAPIEIAARPQLSVVAFRLTRAPGEALDDWNRRSAAFLAAINARDRVHLSSTLLPSADGPAFTLRVCVLCFRTHADRIDAALEDIDAALDALA